MSIEAKDVQVFILAGGHSSRMGKDKGLLIWKGKSFVEHIIETVNTIFENVIILSNQPEKYKQFGCLVLRDRIQDIGPLGGLYTGLNHSSKNLNLFVTCDSPKLSIAYFHHFLHEANREKINYSRVGEKLHPLSVLLYKDVLREMEKRIQDKEYKLLDFYQQFNANPIDMSSYAEEMININTPEEYNSLISPQ